MRQKVHAGGTLEVATPDEIAKLLREFAKSGHHAFGSAKIEKELENWPVMGHQRQIRVPMTHGTNNFLLPANAYTDVFEPNAGRGGLSMINIGANPAFVFLTSADEARQMNGYVASGWLAANGGAWDGRIGDGQWVGEVSALSVLGTTLVLAEI
ncbi:MAG: hypothetical protein KGL39_32130 [Patescibacteria group bacterium]|nr:hypothetical protein [Patescibacteria group bacterium]